MRTRGALLGVGTLALVIICFLSVPFGAGAQSPTPGAGGVTINLFCMDFGKKFPEGQTIKAQGLADAKVRSALNYALQKGYIQSNPYEVQLAVWNLVDGQPFHDVNNRGTTLAQEIVSNAGATPPAGSASDVGDITVTNIKAADANAAFGTGTVSGSLPGGTPIGFLLPAPDSNTQRLVSVVVSTTGQSATAGTSTTGTVAAGTTTSGTATTGTATTGTAGATRAAGTTTTGTTAAGTTTTGTTVAQAATATTAPTATVAPTATRAATATTAPTATRAAASAPVATGTGGATTMPQTGQPRPTGGLNIGIVLLVLAGAVLLAVGLVMRHRFVRR